MYEMGNTKLNEDIVVPLRNQAVFMRFIKQLKRDTGLAIPTFGHAADGNFHVNIMFDRGNKVQERIAKKAVIKLMKTVVEMGGAITGEHGVGLAKSPFLKFQHNKAEIAAMRAIKEVLDPNNILNPGKIFEPYEVWDKIPEKVQLPWDHK
jgi:glycolate oxidase